MDWVEAVEILKAMVRSEEADAWFADDTDIGKQVKESHIKRSQALRVAIQAIKKEAYGKDQGN